MSATRSDREALIIYLSMLEVNLIHENEAPWTFNLFTRQLLPYPALRLISDTVPFLPCTEACQTAVAAFYQHSDALFQYIKQEKNFKAQVIDDFIDKALVGNEAPTQADILVGCEKDDERAELLRYLETHYRRIPDQPYPTFELFDGFTIRTHIVFSKQYEQEIQKRNHTFGSKGDLYSVGAYGPFPAEANNVFISVSPLYLKNLLSPRAILERQLREEQAAERATLALASVAQQLRDTTAGLEQESAALVRAQLELSKTEAALKTLRDEAAKAQQRLTTTQTDLAQQSSALEKVEQAITRSTARRETLKTEIEQAKQECAGFRVETAQAKSERDTAMTLVADARAERDRANSEKERAQAETRAIIAERDALSAELESLRETLRQQRDEKNAEDERRRTRNEEKKKRLALERAKKDAEERAATEAAATARAQAEAAAAARARAEAAAAEAAARAQAEAAATEAATRAQAEAAATEAATRAQAEAAATEAATRTQAEAAARAEAEAVQTAITARAQAKIADGAAGASDDTVPASAKDKNMRDDVIITDPAPCLIINDYHYHLNPHLIKMPNETTDAAMIVVYKQLKEISTSASSRQFSKDHRLSDNLLLTKTVLLLLLKDKAFREADTSLNFEDYLLIGGESLVQGRKDNQTIYVRLKNGVITCFIQDEKGHSTTKKITEEQFGQPIPKSARILIENHRKELLSALKGDAIDYLDRVELLLKSGIAIDADIRKALKQIPSSDRENIIDLVRKRNQCIVEHYVNVCVSAESDPAYIYSLLSCIRTYTRAFNLFVESLTESLPPQLIDRTIMADDLVRAKEQYHHTQDVDFPYLRDGVFFGDVIYFKAKKILEYFSNHLPPHQLKALLAYKTPHGNVEELAQRIWPESTPYLATARRRFELFRAAERNDGATFVANLNELSDHDLLYYIKRFVHGAHADMLKGLLTHLNPNLATLDKLCNGSLLEMLFQEHSHDLKPAHLPCMKLLLTHRATVNSRSTDHGQTPLHAAIINRDINSATLLSRHNADAAIEDIHRLTAVETAIKSLNHNTHAEQFIANLVKTSPALNKNKCLLLAAREGWLAVIRNLMKQGASLDEASNERGNALHNVLSVGLPYSRMVQADKEAYSETISYLYAAIKPDERAIALAKEKGFDKLVQAASTKGIYNGFGQFEQGSAQSVATPVAEAVPGQAPPTI